MCMCLRTSGRGLVGLGHLNGVQGVAGSNPAAPTMNHSLSYSSMVDLMLGFMASPFSI